MYIQGLVIGLKWILPPTNLVFDWANVHIKIIGPDKNVEQIIWIDAADSPIDASLMPTATAYGYVVHNFIPNSSGLYQLELLQGSPNLYSTREVFNLYVHPRWATAEAVVTPAIMQSLGTQPYTGNTQYTEYASAIANPMDVASNGQGRWVMVGYDALNNAQVMRSDSGVIWDFPDQPAAAPANINFVASNRSGLWIATSGLVILKSDDDGVTWTNEGSASGIIIDAKYCPSVGKLAVFVQDGYFYDSLFDGTTWLSHGGTNQQFQALAISPEYAISAGLTSITRYFTDDLTVWTDLAGSPLNTAIYGGDYGNGYYAFVDSTGQCHFCTDPLGTWTTVDIDPGKTDLHDYLIWLDIDQRWITCNSVDNTWYQSTDLLNWSLITTGELSGQTARIRSGHSENTGYVLILTDNTLISKVAI